MELVAETRTGEALLLARGTAKCTPDAAAFARTVNRILRRPAGESVGRGNDAPTGPRIPQTSAKSALLRLLRLAKPEFGFIALTVLFFVASTAISLVIPFINRHMVDDYIRNP